MFDQILDLVKQQIGNNPQVASAIPPGQADAVNQEIAHQVTTGLASQAVSQGGVGGLMSMLQGGGMSAGNPVISSITNKVVSSLGSKFGLPPAATSAIAAALPALLQKFAHKTNDPNDNSITPGSITESLSKLGKGGLGNLGNLGGLGGLFK
ncbi:DUF937 domain-containing protein [Rufibacter tibetensis]|uniref:DUF937 domain-containing protein n=1 Tax=Rufibacter tibetensis TaxID=512763 RepID=A0A0P0CYK9_9BACT|nr:DUF937 domain-containing protein [Rufibacter tibetensis]ALI99611.1 hypothetical protein DC20_12310 [Rufibacter tibetensis]